MRPRILDQGVVLGEGAAGHGELRHVEGGPEMREIGGHLFSPGLLLPRRQHITVHHVQRLQRVRARSEYVDVVDQPALHGAYRVQRIRDDAEVRRALDERDPVLPQGGPEKPDQAAEGIHVDKLRPELGEIEHPGLYLLRRLLSRTR